MRHISHVASIGDHRVSTGDFARQAGFAAALVDARFIGKLDRLRQALRHNDTAAIEAAYESLGESVPRGTPESIYWMMVNNYCNIVSTHYTALEQSLAAQASMQTSHMRASKLLFREAMIEGFASDPVLCDAVNQLYRRRAINEPRLYEKAHKRLWSLLNEHIDKELVPGVMERVERAIDRQLDDQRNQNTQPMGR